MNIPEKDQGSGPLKPCPFCGGNDLEFTYTTHYGHGDSTFSHARVMCKSCKGAKGNGFYYGTTPDYENNITWRFKVDTSGRVYPALTTSYVDSGSGAPSAMVSGSIYMRTDSSRTVDLSPVWVGVGGVSALSLPLQVVRSTTTVGRPSAPAAIGTMMFDTTLGKPVWWNGTNWVDATGTVV